MLGALVGIPFLFVSDIVSLLIIYLYICYIET